jgi:hypothetical protein
VTTERFQWVRRRGLLKRAIEPSRVAWTPARRQGVSPFGRRHRPIAEGAQSFVASRYRPCVWPTRVAFIDGIPSSSRRAGHPSARAVGLPSRQSQTMKTLLRTLANLLAGRRSPSIEEPFLAQAVDAQDLQVCLLALERARP